MNKLELQALMTADPNTIMTHPFTGKPAAIGEVLKAILNGEGMTLQVAPTHLAPAQPGQHAGPNLRISQAAINALTEAQYQELKETGHLQGLTNSDNGRAYVHVRQGGSHTVRLSFDPETGAVGPERPLDMRDFTDPAAETK
jgi:hypothetical protein